MELEIFARTNKINYYLKIPPVNLVVERKTLASQLQKEERFFQFWRQKNLSKIDYIRSLITVASVSNNLSWIFFSAYQCAIRYHFKQKIRGTISLAVRETSDAPVKATFDNKKNILSLNGRKSWLVSTNVEMILLFVRLKKPIELPLNNSTRLLNSILIPIYKEKSAIRKTFEKTRFLKNLNQGNLELKNTEIMIEKIFSGKNIRGFGDVEQFFVMLSLGIFFVTKVKSLKLKKFFLKEITALVQGYNARKSIRLLVKSNKKTFKKLINRFDQLPEKKAIIDWNNDKVIFRNILK